MTSQNKQAYVEQAEKLAAALADLSAEHPLRTLLVESAALFAQVGQSSEQDAHHDNTLVALIDRGYHWRPVDSSTPRGSKVKLINRWSGVAIYGTIGSHEKFFTHWAPLPTFPRS
jgi:hypothetical protein